jgi:pimeloyl-ACP methyl ester carboxylesterase
MNVPPGQPPLFVFQSNFVYWSVMKLAGRSMMGMFVPKELLNDLPKQEKNQLIQDIFFSALPVTRRSKGIEFDLLVSNPSINGNIQFDRITSPTLILNAVDDPATLIEGARNLETVIHGSQLLTFDTGGHVLLGHGEEIKSQISDFIQVHQ